MSDSDQWLNCIQLDLISLLVNVVFEMGLMVARYDFLEVKLILIYVRGDTFLSHFHVNWGRYDFLDEWYRAMFEPTPNWPNITFDQLFSWIGSIMVIYYFLEVNRVILSKYSFLWPIYISNIDLLQLLGLPFFSACGWISWSQISN